MYVEQFSHRFLNGFFYELGFGGGCGSGGKVVPLEQFSHRLLNGFFYELGFGGGCGSGGKVVHLEQFSDRFLNGFFYELGFGRSRRVELAGRARSWRIRVAHPTPHPNWESRPGTPLVIFLGVG